MRIYVLTFTFLIFLTPALASNCHEADKLAQALLNNGFRNMSISNEREKEFEAEKSEYSMPWACWKLNDWYSFSVGSEVFFEAARKAFKVAASICPAEKRRKLVLNVDRSRANKYRAMEAQRRIEIWAEQNCM